MVAASLSDTVKVCKIAPFFLKKLCLDEVSMYSLPLIFQLGDVVIEEWKRTPVATCEALVNSMPKRVKAVLENNGGHTKY